MPTLPDKWQALYQFWSSFGIPAYAENSVPEEAEMPYITYEGEVGNFDKVLSLSAQIFYYDTSDDPFMSLNYVKNTDNGKALADVDNKSAVRMAMTSAPYDDTATYAVGDYCTYGDRLWKCNTAIGTAEPFTAAHWTATTVMEEIS